MRKLSLLVLVEVLSTSRATQMIAVYPQELRGAMLISAMWTLPDRYREL